MPNVQEHVVSLSSHQIRSNAACSYHFVCHPLRYVSWGVDGLVVDGTGSGSFMKPEMFLPSL
jgi:hypothetical protein